MRSPIINIIIGAATLAAAVYLIEKYFTATKEPTDAALKDMAQDDRGDVVTDDQQCIFPEQMITETPYNEVSNWGNLSGRRFLSYKYQNPPEYD